MEQLLEFLRTAPPGDLPADSGLDRILTDCWEIFDGSDLGGMEPYKLCGRMEQVRWTPPLLSFAIERHGGTVCGSTRAELQFWELDIERRTARIAKTRYRQLAPMAQRLSMRPLAEEIAALIASRQDDPRLRWLDESSVRVLASKVVPVDSGYKRTVESRRKRFVEFLAELLRPLGWERTYGGVFRRSKGELPSSNQPAERLQEVQGE